MQGREVREGCPRTDSDNSKDKETREGIELSRICQ